MMKQFSFSFTVTSDDVNADTVRIVRVHVEQISKITHGLCNYKLNLGINEKEDTRNIERTIPNVRYLETPLDAIAWVIGLYPEINTVTVPEHEPTDPVMTLRKEIEATDTVWRKVRADIVRPNDIVMWNGVHRTVYEIKRTVRPRTLMFRFSDGTVQPIENSTELLIAVKENETL